MTNDELSTLRELAAKATPGPWTFTYAAVRKYLGNDDEYHVAELPRVAGDTETRRGGCDGEFIAAANPTAVLALLDEIDHWRSENEKYMRAMAGISESSPSELAEIYAGTCEVRDRLRRQLSAMTAARDEARDIAYQAIEDNAAAMPTTASERIGELRKVGR